MRPTLLALLLGVAGCHSQSEHQAPPQHASPKLPPSAVEPRSAMLPAYPCSSCHATRTPHPERYELKEFHQVRNHEFSHGEDAFWCYQCHALKDIDQLTTATGQLVSFDDAWKICTSCHGDKAEDWRNGAHGLITGNWNGARTKKSCPSCHDPHDPRYPSIRPEAPPEPPKGLKAL